MNELEIAVHNCRDSLIEKHLCKGLTERYCAAWYYVKKKDS